MSVKISIVTGYYNRKELFYQTLKSIARSKYKDFELIAVDDCSSPEHRLEDMVDEFPFMRIIRLEKENKWYVNSCIPLNIGMREAKGDIIMLQNPECLHVHDVLTYLSENINETNYISMSAYGLDPVSTSKLPEYNANDTVPILLSELPQRPYTGGSDPGWYNHSRFRPVHFHFCSAMTRNNMAKLNGFDERYANGIAYDDDEIIIRIRRLGLNLIIADNVSVLHQYHDTVQYNKPNADRLMNNNRLLLENITRRENKYNSNIIKLWGGI